MDTVKIAKALSDPIRYKIMLMLANPEVKCCPATSPEEQRAGLCNCELMVELGLIQSRVSYHLKELVEAGLLVEEPRGKWKYYYINPKTLREFRERLSKDFGIE